MKKVVLFFVLVSFFLVPSAFAADVQVTADQISVATVDTVDVKPLEKPKVKDGEVSGDIEPIKDADKLALKKKLEADKYDRATVYAGKVPIIVLSDDISKVTITISYPSGTGDQILFVYDRDKKVWLKASSSSASSVAVAGPATLDVDDNGIFDQDPASGDILVSYAAALAVHDARDNGGSGCSVGTVGGASAVLLLLVPALLFVPRK